MRRPSFLGKLWTSPNTLIGLALGAPALLLGARARRAGNSISFFEHPLLNWLPMRAITFGNVVLYRPGCDPDHVVRCYEEPRTQRLGDHEHAHTLQYERWGPFFLPAYLALAAWTLYTRRPNWLERQADRWAEEDGRSGPTTTRSSPKACDSKTRRSD